MKKTTIILLNLRFADFYSSELFKRLKDNHQIRIIAVLDQHFKDHINPNLLPYLDEIYRVQAPTKDGFLAEFNFNELCEIVEKEMSLSKEIKIVCTDEFNLLHAGHLRRKYHLNGNTDLDLIAFRDKAKMKYLLQKAGLRVPHFKLLEIDDNFINLKKSFGLPFVIKPIDSCGSFGVQIVRDESDFLYIENEIKNSSSQFEVEEYIEGKLYHVDACIQNNKTTFICANEYTWPNHDYTDGKTLGSIPIDSSTPLAQSLIYFAQQVLSVLGSKNLINHMEIFVTKEQELIFLEVSARPPGGLLNLLHQTNFSINLMDLDFFMQTGLFIELPKIQTNGYAFCAIFPLLPGKLKKFIAPMVQSRFKMSYFRELNAVILPEECNSVVDKMAHAIFYHQDLHVLRQDFEYIRTFKLAEMMPLRN